MPKAASLKKICADLAGDVSRLSFAEPVTHVYNPLEYARRPFQLYLERYLAGSTGRTLLLGMNPGPWGMAQTGVPFGEVAAVKDWLGIEARVDEPKGTHPKRPIQGFDCPRSEVSGRRLWGYFRSHLGEAERFAQDFVLLNYCPLIFLEESGRNRIPEKLPRSERDPLFDACDRALDNMIRELAPARVIGVGKFALQQLKAALKRVGRDLPSDSILHPSPANPQANRGWEEKVHPILQAGGHCV